VDVTNGLQYLHQHDFVHGDLKGVSVISTGREAELCPPLTNGDIQANVLINSEHRACLADFGLVAIREPEEASSVDGPSVDKVAGTIRWMAPEILDPARYGYIKRARRKLPSKSTDIYALGMTILEVRAILLPLLFLSRNLNIPRWSQVGDHSNIPIQMPRSYRRF
jgi:serine/threonine protein kinase